MAHYDAVLKGGWVHFIGYQPEIENYFEDRNTSGFVEGFNNKVKVMKRRCYGIFNLEHIYHRLVLDFSGYNLFRKPLKMAYA